jgi:hypothetical protein
MQDLEDSLKNSYKRITKLRENDEYRKCLSCDCYFVLLYHMRDAFSKMENPRHGQMLRDVSSKFDKRNQVNLHQCLGCNPCPPAEWATGLLRIMRK